MSIQHNTMPQFNLPLEKNAVTSKDWYFFWSGLFRGLSPGNENSVTLTGSPFEYNAQKKGFLIVSGGTVSAIAFSRDKATYYNMGVTAGPMPVNAYDQIRITYSVAPTVTFVPT